MVTREDSDASFIIIFFNSGSISRDTDTDVKSRRNRILKNMNIFTNIQF